MMVIQYMVLYLEDILMAREFIKAALIRAARTFLQAVLAVWTAGTLITDVDWKFVLLSALSASIYSLATSLLAGLPEVKLVNLIDMDVPEPEGSAIDEHMSEEQLAAIREKMGGEEDV
jgi:hypothetical protein